MKASFGEKSQKAQEVKEAFGESPTSFHQGPQSTNKGLTKDPMRAQKTPYRRLAQRASETRKSLIFKAQPMKTKKGPDRHSNVHYTQLIKVGSKEGECSSLIHLQELRESICLIGFQLYPAKQSYLSQKAEKANKPRDSKRPRVQRPKMAQHAKS